jgi:hypothetical protein
MRFIFIFILLLISLHISAQKNCTYYKTGKFLLTDVGLGIQTKIERVGDKQFETDMKTGKITVFNVKWINECEYELSIVSGNTESYLFFKSKVLVMRILEVYADGYKFEGHIKGTYKYKSHVMKII